MNITSEKINLPVKTVTWPYDGQTITSNSTNNTYTIGEKIGEGYFSHVYACSDVWNNELAVKVLKPTSTYEKVKEKAIAEFRRLMVLRHPNITFVYDVFELKDTFYIVTERCFGPISDVFSIQNFDGKILLMPLARQLLQAIDYLHLNKYVHQDIHEGNVFSTFVKDEILPDEVQALQFKLGDLGVTKLLNDVDINNTRAHRIMPPEALNPDEFGPVDTRIDFYHVGLLFLQIACSRKIQFTQDEILSGKPRDMALKLPSPYNIALEKTLRRHVVFRTASAKELWRDLNVPSNI